MSRAKLCPPVVLLGLLVASAAMAATPSLHFSAPEIATTARAIPLGGAFVLDGVPLATGKVSRLELRRFQVFAPGASIVVHGEGGHEERFPAPDNAYFRGPVAGLPGATAFLTVRAAGGLRGLIVAPEAMWVLATEGQSPGLQIRAVDLDTEVTARAREFHCGQDELSAVDLRTAFAAAAEEPPAPPRELAGVDRTARLALETDFELWQIFGGNQTNATDYFGDLLGYASTVYENEVSTSLLISSISYWSTSSDPWTQTSTACGLFQFGKYWNDNRAGVSRTLAHFFSGKSTNAGIAWIGVLCSGPFNSNITNSSCPGLTPTTSNYGGGYGYSSGIDGNFNIGNPGLVWDLLATVHEIGHNFNSPHTHCYAGLNGNANVIDGCSVSECGNTGCHCGTASLPGAASQGSGTIMSYCHLLSPGSSNIAYTFGLNHAFGTAPSRVPTRMRDHVVARSAANPSCLVFQNQDAIFDDSFETGNTNGWSLVGQ